MAKVASDLVGRLASDVEELSERIETLQTQIDNLHGGIDNLAESFSLRLKALEERLASKPDDFGGVTSTGEPKTMTRWVIVSALGSLFSAYSGLVNRQDAAKDPRKEPKFFICEEDAVAARDLVFPSHYSVEKVEVVERAGVLREARYA